MIRTLKTPGKVVLLEIDNMNEEEKATENIGNIPNLIPRHTITLFNRQVFILIQEGL